eukprot:7495470-Pyramimonas_sp.AAC.1
MGNPNKGTKAYKEKAKAHRNQNTSKQTSQANKLRLAEKRAAAFLQKPLIREVMLKAARAA